MRKHSTLILFILTIINITPAKAQCCYTDNFSTSSGWIMSGTSYSIGPSNFFFNNTPCTATTGNPFNYATHPIGCTLSDSAWQGDIDFLYTNRGTGGVAHILLAATAGTDNLYYNSASTSSLIASNLDGIEIYISCPYATSQASDSIFAQTKDGTIWSAPSGGIFISMSTLYYLRLDRLNSTNGRLSVFTNAARTIHQTGSPKTFTIASTVTGLNVVQMGSNPGGFYTRELTGTLDNLKICDYTLAGIQENQGLYQSLSIYPNPSSSGFYIDKLSPNSTVRVLDPTTKEILHYEIANDPHFFINTQALSQGIYLVTVNSGNTFYQKKLSIVK